jgi:hypothetical protein
MDSQVSSRVVELLRLRRSRIATQRAGKLKGDDVEGLKHEGSDAKGVELESAHLGSFRVPVNASSSKVAMWRA